MRRGCRSSCKKTQRTPGGGEHSFMARVVVPRNSAHMLSPPDQPVKLTTRHISRVREPMPSRGLPPVVCGEAAFLTPHPAVLPGKGPFFLFPCIPDVQGLPSPALPFQIGRHQPGPCGPKG